MKRLTLPAAAFIEVDAGVRYWEDASLNGVDDLDGKIPCRQGDRWRPVIELATGRILNWSIGLEAKIHYKLCDDGEYWLLDGELTRVAKWSGGYVPDDILCVNTNGYGDYIIFNVSDEGLICDWRAPYLNPEDWVPDWPGA